MPTYEHKCETCKHQWEDEYSIKVDPPKVCPECTAETVVRLISLSGRGVVTLVGQELTDKIKGDAQALKREAATNEKVYANLLGEEKYQNLQTRLDNQKKIMRSK